MFLASDRRPRSLPSSGTRSRASHSPDLQFNQSDICHFIMLCTRRERLTGSIDFYNNQGSSLMGEYNPLRAESLQQPDITLSHSSRRQSPEAMEGTEFPPPHPPCVRSDPCASHLALSRRASVLCERGRTLGEQYESPAGISVVVCSPDVFKCTRS